MKKVIYILLVLMFFSCDVIINSFSPSDYLDNEDLELILDIPIDGELSDTTGRSSINITESLFETGVDGTSNGGFNGLAEINLNRDISGSESYKMSFDLYVPQYHDNDDLGYIFGDNWEIDISDGLGDFFELSFDMFEHQNQGIFVSDLDYDRWYLVEITHTKYGFTKISIDGDVKKSRDFAGIPSYTNSIGLMLHGSSVVDNIKYYTGL